MRPFLTLAVACCAAGAARDASRNAQPEKEVKNVAIIGAGAAGSSAAYHLQKFAEEENIFVNITIFEKTDHIGGRTLTVNVYDDPAQPVELGASIFVTANHIMYNATKNFGLSLTEMSTSEPGDYTAIWDGESFVYQSEKGTSFLWDAAKLWWRYGLAPYRAVKLVKNAVGTFLRLYEEPYFPFRSLTQRAFELGLLRLTGVTGEEYLAENNIHKDFARHIMQPATRVNYASNLGYIHGLEAMVSFATDGAVAVSGGNYQIFEHLLRHSGASFNGNTTVTSIAFQTKGGGKPGSSSKYLLTTKATGSKSRSTSKSPTAFDNVIIASPWQFSGIDAGKDVLKHRIDTIPYMKLHVTLFTSPFQLHAPFFNLPPGSRAPSNVYTTLGKDEHGGEGPRGVGRAGFYSISTLRRVENPKTQKREYLYKVFSAEPVTPEFLSHILGTEVPSSFTTPADKDAQERDGEASVDPISWYYPHWFHSYPIELPRVTFQDPIVGRGLYYTSGIESFISTMETSALMGMNVARLIADDFAGVTRNSRGAMRGDQTPRRNDKAMREDFWDSMDSEMGIGMNFLGADEL